MNGVYAFQDTTKDGKEYYRKKTAPTLYIFYDAAGNYCHDLYRNNIKLKCAHNSKTWIIGPDFNAPGQTPSTAFDAYIRVPQNQQGDPAPALNRPTLWTVHCDTADDETVGSGSALKTMSLTLQYQPNGCDKEPRPYQYTYPSAWTMVNGNGCGNDVAQQRTEIEQRVRAGRLRIRGNW